MSPARKLVWCLGAAAPDAVRSFVERMEFGPSVVPELREVLLSTSEGAFYDRDGRLIELREVPFLGEWRLS